MTSNLPDDDDEKWLQSNEDDGGQWALIDALRNGQGQGGMMGGRRMMQPQNPNAIGAALGNLGQGLGDANGRQNGRLMSLMDLIGKQGGNAASLFAMA